MKQRHAVHESSAMMLGVHLLQGETYDVPQPCPAGASLDELAQCVQGVLDVFVAKGYAQKVSL